MCSRAVPQRAPEMHRAFAWCSSALSPPRGLARRFRLQMMPPECGIWHWPPHPLGRAGAIEHWST
eukprot:3511760-Alexandrium_andersonii.AAC.1